MRRKVGKRVDNANTGNLLTLVQVLGKNLLCTCLQSCGADKGIPESDPGFVLDTEGNRDLRRRV